MSDRIDESRRRLCQLACAGGGLIALSALPGCAKDDGDMAECSAASIAVGDAKAIAVGSAMYIPSIKVFVCRDDAGYYAMDSECTHIGTEVTFVDVKSGFRCPLHGSTFDYNGKVMSAPATTDLPHFSLCTTESGILVVDTAKRVTADTRLVV